MTFSSRLSKVLQSVLLVVVLFLYYFFYCVVTTTTYTRAERRKLQNFVDFDDATTMRLANARIDDSFSSSSSSSGNTKNED